MLCPDTNNSVTRIILSFEVKFVFRPELDNSNNNNSRKNTYSHFREKEVRKKH